MTDNTRQRDIIPEIWTIIGQYADLDLSECKGLPHVIQVVERVGEMRREAEVAEPVLSQVTRPCMEVPQEVELRTRGDLMRYAGFVEHRDAQFASLYELLLRKRHDYDQNFPMVVRVLGDEIVVDPGFDPMDVVNETMTPIPDAHLPLYHAMLARYGVLVQGNPWTYRYLWRDLGPRAETLPERFWHALRVKRNAILMLKAHFFVNFLAGNVPGALAESVGDHGDNKYQQLVQVVVMWLNALMVVLWDMAMRACQLVNFDWYRMLSPPAQAAMDLVVLVVTLYAGYTLFRRKPYNLARTKTKKADRFLGQVLTESGMVYKVRVDGRELTLSTDDRDSVCHQDEMAMPGSEYFPCRKQPIGALLVTTNNTDLQIFGIYWRLDDYLITARHCSNTLNQSTARVYLAKLKETKRGNYEVDRTDLYRAPDDFFAPEHNVIAAYDVDAFARPVESKIWSQIGVTCAPVKVRSSYGQQVHSVGFTPDGLLVSASGKTLPDSGFEVLHHTASTQKGFSGSILLCGNSVVGMHVSAAGEHNVAVRTELIQYLIDAGSDLESYSKNRKKYTYADASYKEFYRQQKWRGGVVDMKRMRDGKYAIVLQNGEATYGWDVRGLAECFGPTGDFERDADYFDDLISDSVFRRNHRQQYIDFDDDRYHKGSYENASVSGSVARQKAKTTRKKKVQVPKQSVKVIPYTVTNLGKPIHGPSAPKEQPEALQVVHDHIDEIVAMGYEEGKFAYPDMSPNSERVSLEKHLMLYGERGQTIKQAPSQDESSRCAKLVAEMMQAATFVPNANYKTVEGLYDIINSSIIDPSKASGYPYCTEGKPTNALVLEQYGERGFAQHVLNQWDQLTFWVKWFLKGEPTKKVKLDKEMPRGVQGFPLHVTVKHASVFNQLAMTMVKQWKKIPVKYAFSPAKTGHIEHLKECLPGEVWESDKSVWDYNCYLWIANIVRDSIKMLAVKPAEWTDEQFDEYRDDIDGCFKQVFEEARFRTSDGHSYEVHLKGIMKSGWFMTIGVNSIAQIAVHVMVCIRLGMTDEEILNLPIIAGGDDVNQAPVPAGKEAYLVESKKLGIEMEIHERSDLYESEYFSSDLRMGDQGPEFYPKRWTKHIEHIKTIRKEHLADALVSHMENYRHHVGKFNLLVKMYLSLEEKYPAEFPKSKLVSRDLLLARQYGYEHALIC